MQSPFIGLVLGQIQQSIATFTAALGSFVAVTVMQVLHHLPSILDSSCLPDRGIRGRSTPLVHMRSVEESQEQIHALRHYSQVLLRS